jgi:hypothetical protein
VSQDRSFHGSSRIDGERDRQVAAIVTALVVTFVLLALAKPWGWAVAPTPAPARSPAAAMLPAASIPTTAPDVPSAALPGTLDSLASAPFTMPAPPPASASWTALRWRRLAPDDPLDLVRSVLRWNGGFIALGWDEAATPPTPVWTSTDGVRWEPVPFDTSTTFWPGTVVLGVGAVPSGLVVLTEAANDCSGSPCTLRYVPPVISWTSSDGRAWTPHVVVPEGWLSGPTNSPAVVAVGPAGVVAASRSPAARIATSTDGVEWRSLPANTLPARFWLSDLRATATGYVAAGLWMTSATHPDAASFWSPDGRYWSREPTLLPTSVQPGSDVGSEVDDLVVGRDGLIAVGRGVTTPGATLWWQSSDGRAWTALPEFPPLGSTTCTSEGCGLQPDGDLVGDGRRLLALRGGSDVPAWASSDGRSWRRLTMTGDIPGVDAYAASLLPGGVLLTDGATTWFGAAVIR